MGGPAGGRWIDACQSQLAEIQCIDEDIDHPNRIGIRNLVVEAFW